MNLLLRQPAGAPWIEPRWHRELLALQRRLNPALEQELGFRLCAQNWQNVLCEVSKYWQAESGVRKPKQRYTPRVIDASAHTPAVTPGGERF